MSRVLTPTDLRSALARLSLTQAGAARRWGVGTRTVEDWCAGRRAIPGTVRTILALEELAMVPRAQELARAPSLS